MKLTKSLLKSRKAQFFILSAFAIVSILFFISRWVEPYTIVDTSQILLSDEIFIFNNIVEKTNETIYASKSIEELKYNLEEYKIFAEEYALKKDLRLSFDISKVNYGNPTTGYIYILLSSPRMNISKNLTVSKTF